MKPNIFSYATKELSQDAFLCWILSWGDPKYETENKALHKCGQEIIRYFLDLNDVKIEEIKEVTIKKQDRHIDVLCMVNKDYPIVIEDKTDTSTHGNQLERYLETILNRNILKENISLIYYKTGDQSDYNRELKAGYKPVNRKHVLRIIEKYLDGSSEILQQYYEKIVNIEGAVKAYGIKKISEWKGVEVWKGFYMALKEKIPKIKWYPVNNPAGGFLNAFISGSNWKGNNVYLQIEQGKLCFKIEPPKSVNNVDVINLSLIRNQFCHFVINKAKELGLNEIKKPKRFGTGTVMTSAVIEKDLWLGKDDEIVSIDKAVESLNKYIDFFEKL